jgi:hypothetical protein
MPDPSSREKPGFTAQIVSAIGVAVFVAALFWFVAGRSAPPPPPPLPSALP